MVAFFDAELGFIVILKNWRVMRVLRRNRYLLLSFSCLPREPPRNLHRNLYSFEIASEYFIQRWALLTFSLKINGRRCKNNVRFKRLLFNRWQSFNLELKISMLRNLFNIRLIESHSHSFLFTLFLIKMCAGLSFTFHPRVSDWFWGSRSFQLSAAQDSVFEFLHFRLI